MATSALENGSAERELREQRLMCGIAGAVYLVWWFAVQGLLPGSFNPLPSRLAVVASFLVLLAASYRSRWVADHLSTMFAGAACFLVGHYFYLVVGNDGDPTWWIGAFVTVAATAMCLQTRREVAVFSLFVMGCVVYAAVVGHQLASSIYVPGLATILLLANVAKRSQALAEDAKVQTERVRLERDRAEEASRFKSMFLGLVSHELLTPLQTIRLNTDALAHSAKADAPDRRQDRIERIARGVARLTDLIDSLLQHARIDHGKLAVLTERFDLVELVADTVDELASQAQAKKLELKMDASPPSRTVSSDPRLVRIVLVNLVANAIKYTDKGSISVEVRHEASTYRVSVRDTGRGIAPEDRERIFEPFTQLEPLQHKHVPGLGLGLSLVKEMTSALGARLELTSAPSAGSTFTLVLPAGAEAVVA